VRLKAAEMKVPVPVRSKSFKKSRGTPACSLPLLLLIAGVMYVMIGMYVPQILFSHSIALTCFVREMVMNI
jgi:hypothetical protein